MKTATMTKITKETMTTILNDAIPNNEATQSSEVITATEKEVTTNETMNIIV